MIHTMLDKEPVMGMSITTISPVGLDELLNEGTQVELIDVRTPVEYREVHLDFARNVPLDQLDRAVQEL